MNNDYVHLSVLLDRSGSMQSIKKDTIGGFNNLIAEQKKLPGKLSITLAQFDTVYEVLYNAAEVHSVNDLTDASYQPRGATALLDSAKKLIKDTGAALAAMSENDRPGKVMVVMITDGEENASHDTTNGQLKELIKHQEEVYKWDFVYLGADQDAFHNAQKFGAKGMNYAKGKMGQTMAAFSSNVKYNRDFAASGQSVRSITQDDLNEAGAND